MLDKLRLTVELEQEEVSGRWIADVPDLPGVLVYGDTRAKALAKVKLLALEVILDRLTNGEDPLTGRAQGQASPPTDVLAEFRGLEFEYALAS